MFGFYFDGFSWQSKEHWLGQLVTVQRIVCVSKDGQIESFAIGCCWLVFGGLIDVVKPPCSFRRTIVFRKGSVWSASFLIVNLIEFSIAFK